jgi:hypothetical protein
MVARYDRLSLLATALYRVKRSTMEQFNQKPGLDQAAVYQIQVQGKLDERWSDWFNGMTITVESESDGPPITTLTGPVADQAALRGILSKIWDLNLTLITVTRIEMGS